MRIPLSIPRLKQISAVSDSSYEIIFDDDGTDLKTTCSIDEEGPIPTIVDKPGLLTTGQIGDPRPIAAAIRAFHDAYRGDLNTWRRKNPDQSAQDERTLSATSHLKWITATSDDTYEVVFDDGGMGIKLACAITTPALTSGVVWEQDLFSSGQLGDPRPIAAAVMAFHHGCHGDLTTYHA